MSDQFVLQAQKYLNNTYQNNSQWVMLTENGNTGTAMMEGLVRAFQIQNGVPNATGYLGPYTVQVMKNLPTISKMDPEDDADPNVCLIQCALFCKGYHAGGITGIYYTNGVNAVKEMQSDASIEVTGTINWKVWMGLFSLNWFQLVSGGNSTVRLIQKQLNEDWSDVIGVQACDGIISRNTALSLLGALQAAEGLVDWIDDLSELNFGPSTSNYFPTALQQGQNGSYIKYNKIAQYGLYFNGMNQNRFDGIFDGDMTSNVSQFQEKYGLKGMISDTLGTIGVSTMKSLLTSKGDTNRNALACDCSTVLNQTQIQDLYNDGYRYIGRYLTGTVGTGDNERSKAMTKSEINMIQNTGLSIFPIYQDGGYYENYFKKSMQGSYDAITAINQAKKLGFTFGTTIYFAVDFDCLEYQTDAYIIPYFQQIRNAFNQGVYNTKNYKIGIYAPRFVCTKVYEAGLCDFSFVADMSTGFSGNLGYPIPENWAFDQFVEFTYSSTPNFDLDNVGVSGLDAGCRKVDTTQDDTDEDRLYQAQRKYTNCILRSTGLLDKFLNLGVEFNFENGSYNLGTTATENIIISAILKTSESLKLHSSSSNTISITWNGNELSSGFKTSVDQIKSQVQDTELQAYIESTLEDVATSVKVGNISYQIVSAGVNTMKLSLICETDNLLEFDDVTGNVSIELEFTITATGDMEESIDFSNVGQALSTVLLASLMIALCCFVGVEYAPLVVSWFTTQYLAQA